MKITLTKYFNNKVLKQKNFFPFHSGQKIDYLSSALEQSQLFHSSLL